MTALPKKLDKVLVKAFFSDKADRLIVKALKLARHITVDPEDDRIAIFTLPKNEPKFREPKNLDDIIKAIKHLGFEEPYVECFDEEDNMIRRDLDTNEWFALKDLDDDDDPGCMDGYGTH